MPDRAVPRLHAEFSSRKNSCMRIWASQTSLNGRSHCLQKRQQRCWESAGLGSGGVVLDSSAKSSTFSAETTLEATDSASIRKWLGEEKLENLVDGYTKGST